MCESRRVRLFRFDARKLTRLYGSGWDLVLELYATEIQMYSELKDSKKMKVCPVRLQAGRWFD